MGVVVPVIFLVIAMAASHVLTRGGDTVTASFFYRAGGLHRISVVPYYMIWFTSLAVMCKTFVSSRNGLAAGVMMTVIAVASTLWLPHGGETTEVYPFVNQSIRIVGKGVMWQSYDSWTGLSMRVQRLISYAWLTMLPLAAIVISYFRFKEIESKL